MATPTLANRQNLPEPCFALVKPVKVYAEPPLESHVVAEFSPGDELTLGRFINLEEIEGRYWRWYAVEYKLNGQKHAGYIWTPENYNNDLLRHKDTLFYCDAQYNEATKNGVAALYAKHNGKVVSATANVVSTGFSALRAHETDLTGVSFIFSLYTSNEACGYPDETNYFAWTGEKFVPLQSVISLLDEWRGVYYTERIIWPADAGLRDAFIKVTLSVEILEDENGGYIDGKSSYLAQVYKWNGREAVLQTQDGELERWWRPNAYGW